MTDKLKNYIHAGYGALLIQTSEYFRCTKDILDTVAKLKGEVFSWDATGTIYNFALDQHGAQVSSINASDTYELADVLGSILKRMEEMEVEDMANPTVWIINDFHLFMKDVNPADVALFRNAVRIATATNTHIILLGAGDLLCPEIETQVTFLEYDLPDPKEISRIVSSIAQSTNQSNWEADKEAVITACSGMTAHEIADAVSFSLVTQKRISPDLILKEKSKAVEKSGALKYCEPKFHIDDVGGLDELIEYISLRKDSFTKEAQDFGCPPPKGIVLVGAAGTGKSLIAKVTADILKRPLITLDVGAVFGSLVGASEGNMRSAIKTIEAIAPCVLMIDEIEKGLSGGKSSGKTDGGTGSRVIGTLLSWMNDKTSEVYIVATANDVTQLPPELLRKGRFDELFFVDLPNEEERKKIFEIHIKKRGRKPSKFDLDALVKSTEGFTGAEIEQCIIDALYVAFGKKSDLTTEFVLNSIDDTSPLSVINSSQIDGLKAWADGRCRYASSAKRSKQTKKTKQVSGRALTV